LAGLDRERSGRPPSFTALQVAQVKALATVKSTAASSTPIGTSSSQTTSSGRDPDATARIAQTTAAMAATVGVLGPYESP
jgi:hypothetical protein